MTTYIYTYKPNIHIFGLHRSSGSLPSQGSSENGGTTWSQSHCHDVGGKGDGEYDDLCAHPRKNCSIWWFKWTLIGRSCYRFTRFKGQAWEKGSLLLCALITIRGLCVFLPRMHSIFPIKGHGHPAFIDPCLARSLIAVLMRWNGKRSKKRRERPGNSTHRLYAVLLHVVILCLKYNMNWSYRWLKSLNISTIMVPGTKTYIHIQSSCSATKTKSTS